MHELTLLSTHLKYNLWVGQDYDFVSLGDDIGIHLDAAMIVRREGVPGARSPDGILTRLEGDWQHDPQMEDAVKKMPEGIRPDKVKDALKARHKLGRNNPCPCGSGRKYKKCCLRR
jgi:hypothetical protein